MTSAHCPSCGPLPPLPDGTFACPICLCPIVVNATGGHGVAWADDANRVFPDPVLPDPTRLPDIPSDRERQQREVREQHT